MIIIIIIIIIIAFKGIIQDFYNLTAPRTVSNTFAQVARISCANHVQHIERLSRASCHVTCHVVQRDCSAIKFYRVEITFIWALFYWLNHSPMTQCLELYTCLVSRSLHWLRVPVFTLTGSLPLHWLWVLIFVLAQFFHLYTDSALLPLHRLSVNAPVFTQTQCSCLYMDSISQCSCLYTDPVFLSLQWLKVPVFVIAQCSCLYMDSVFLTLHWLSVPVFTPTQCSCLYADSVSLSLC